MPILTKVTEEQFKTIPEAMQDAYEKKDDGNYYLTGVDGYVPKAKVDEFRETSKTTKAELDKAIEELKKFDGVDLKVVAELQKQAKDLEDKKLIDAGDIDQIVNERVKPIVEAAKKEASDLQSALNMVNRQLGILTIDNKATELGVEAGIQKSAIPDLVMRANRQFQIVDGKAKALDSEEKPVFAADGITPLTLDKTWIETMKTDAPHLFTPPKGTGSGPGDGNRAPGSGDPSKMSSVQKINEGLNADS